MKLFYSMRSINTARNLFGVQFNTRPNPNKLLQKCLPVITVTNMMSSLEHTVYGHKICYRLDKYCVPESE